MTTSTEQEPRWSLSAVLCPAAVAALLLGHVVIMLCALTLSRANPAAIESAETQTASHAGARP